MPLVDLFDLADENARRLDDRFRALEAGSPPPDPGDLRRFEEAVTKHGRVALNMRPWIAAEFVRTGKYLNMNDAVREDAALSGRPENELLRERLGRFYQKRVSFDATFDDGCRFQYGVLNIGSAGPRSYGLFCFVLKKTFPKAGDRVAYLKRDSLNGYVADDGRVDTGSLHGDLAPHSHRHRLAALKHSDDLDTRRADWPAMLCSDDDYVEAIFVADLGKTRVSEIRIARSDYESLWELCFRAHGRRLSDGEKALAFDFRVVLEAGRNRVITLKVLDDA